MDDPDTPLDELLGALDELAWINRLLGGFGPSIKGIRSLLRADQNAFSLLDVGSGGGDMARRLHTWAAGRGLEARIQGIDLSPPIVARAQQHCEDLETVQHRVQDLMSLNGHEAFDIVHCAIVLHHLDDPAAAAALEKMFAVSRWGLVVNDLHRHPLPYYFIRLLTRLLSRNRMIRNDGPLSVRRAFRRHELESLARQAGLPKPSIEWHWGFRWLMVFRK
ncbi:MAG: methyltransferase domain-containing protein [Acidobacteriota bacterium]